MASYSYRCDPSLMPLSVEGKAGVPAYPLHSQDPTLFVVVSHSMRDGRRGKLGSPAFIRGAPHYEFESAPLAMAARSNHGVFSGEASVSKGDAARGAWQDVWDRSQGISSANKYVIAAELNGEILDRAWVRHAEIVKGGKFTLTMAATPGSWPSGPAPPSGSSLQ